MSPEADITLPELANLCDMFYIGGTKCGAIMGEALVILNPALKGNCYIDGVATPACQGKIFGAAV